MKKKLLLICFTIVLSTVGLFAQSKKEQIEILTQKLDSFVQVTNSKNFQLDSMLKVNHQLVESLLNNKIQLDSVSKGKQKLQGRLDSLIFIHEIQKEILEKNTHDLYTNRMKLNKMEQTISNLEKEKVDLTINFDKEKQRYKDSLKLNIYAETMRQILDSIKLANFNENQVEIRKKISNQKGFHQLYEVVEQAGAMGMITYYKENGKWKAIEEYAVRYNEPSKVIKLNSDLISSLNSFCVKINDDLSYSVFLNNVEVTRGNFATDSLNPKNSIEIDDKEYALLFCKENIKMPIKMDEYDSNDGEFEGKYLRINLSNNELELFLDSNQGNSFVYKFKRK